MQNPLSPQISTQILFPIVERSRVIGYRARPLLEKVGVEPTILEDVNEMVRLEKYIRFFELAAKETGRVHFGLETGKSITSESLGALGFLFSSAPRLKDALGGFEDFLSAVQEGTHASVSIKGAVCENFFSGNFQMCNSAFFELSLHSRALNEFQL